MKEKEIKVTIPFEHQITELFENESIELTDKLLPKIHKIFDEYKDMVQETIDVHIEQVEKMAVSPGTFQSGLRKGAINTLIHLKNVFKKLK